MADFSQSAWQDRLPRLSTAERQQHMRDLARDIHRITDEAGRVLDFSSPPDRLGPSPLPLFPVRDRSGNVVQKAAPAPETKVPPIRKGFTLDNRQSFEGAIQHEPEAMRNSLRLQYDALRKQHGID